MEEKNRAAKIIEHIVNTASLTNKWLMWCEGNAPDQSVFVPSIFQMRDAYSHIIKLFGKGINDGTISTDNTSFDTLFNESYSLKQLEEAFGHSTRAFYDCADYILIVIKKDIDECEKNDNKMFLSLRNKLLKNDAYITELRSAKSEDMDGNYENIKKWDLFLQLITSSYVFGDIEFELLRLSHEIQTKLDFIESNYSSEIIKNHSPSFYEDKRILIELETLPTDFEEYLKDDTYISSQVLENSQKWCDDIITKINAKITKANEYSALLDGLQKIMFNSNVIQKRNNRVKAVWGFLSGIISWVFTNFLSSTFLFDFSVTLPDQTQSISATKMNLLLLCPFIVIFLIVFWIGYAIANAVFKKKLKNNRS